MLDDYYGCVDLSIRAVERNLILSDIDRIEKSDYFYQIEVRWDVRVGLKYIPIQKFEYWFD